MLTANGALPTPQRTFPDGDPAGEPLHPERPCPDRAERRSKAGSSCWLRRRIAAQTACRFDDHRDAPQDLNEGKTS